MLNFTNLAFDNVLFIYLIQATTLVNFFLKQLEDLLGRTIFEFGLTESPCIKVVLNPQNKVVVDANLHAAIQ